MTERIRQIVKEGRRVVMPLPKYGRGLEIICMLRRDLPEVRIGAEENMVKLTRQTLSYSQWVRPEAAQEIRRFLEENPISALEKGEYDVLLIGDTHLEQPESQELAREEAEKGALTLLTGRVKKGVPDRTAAERRKGLYHGLSPSPEPEGSLGDDGGK